MFGKFGGIGKFSKNLGEILAKKGRITEKMQGTLGRNVGVLGEFGNFGGFGVNIGKFGENWSKKLKTFGRKSRKFGNFEGMGKSGKENNFREKKIGPKVEFWEIHGNFWQFQGKICVKIREFRKNLGSFVRI